MRWFSRLRNPLGLQSSPEPTDVAGVVSDGLKDPVSAQKAIFSLKLERKRLLQQAKIVEKSFRRPTTRGIRQSGRLGPQLGTFQMSQDLRNADAASHDSSRAEQIVAIERQLEAIDSAVSQLRERISQ